MNREQHKKWRKKRRLIFSKIMEKYPESVTTENLEEINKKIKCMENKGNGTMELTKDIQGEAEVTRKLNSLNLNGVNFIIAKMTIIKYGFYACKIDGIKTLVIE